MFVLIAVLQVISGLGLIFLVLLHSGKGGGLSDMFGGGIGSQTAGSTVVEQNLDRITVVTGLVFAFTTISLGLLYYVILSEWRNWQTRKVKDLVPD